MATLQDAVQSDSAFAKATLGAERTAGLQLEEVESGHLNGKDVWLITLSMLSSFSFANAFGNPRREYKVFMVLKETGEVASMKTRELAVT